MRLMRLFTIQAPCHELIPRGLALGANVRSKQKLPFARWHSASCEKLRLGDIVLKSQLQCGSAAASASATLAVPLTG